MRFELNLQNFYNAEITSKIQFHIAWIWQEPILLITEVIKGQMEHFICWDHIVRPNK